MIHRILLIGILFYTFFTDAMAKVSTDEAWLFGQLRVWVTNHNGPGDRWDGNTDAGVNGHPEITQADPLYRKLSSQFSRKSGIIYEERPPLFPRGKLVWWDVDNDGTKDIVFAGGASPHPYFVILKATGDTWRVWQDCQGRLLTIFTKDNRVVLVSAFDGYGIARDKNLNIRICNPREQGSCADVTFRWVGELRGLATKGTVSTCTTIRDTSLRITPEVDNTPDDSGMGFEWPGNLYQKLTRDSSGWLLNRTKNRKGEPWSLVVFPDSMTMEDGKNHLRAITTPKKVRRSSSKGGLLNSKLMVGWIKTRDLNGR